MLLDSKNIPEIQRLIDSECADDIERIRGADVTLTVVLFLALSHHSLLDAGNADLARKVTQMDLPGVGGAVECLGCNGEQESAEPFGSPSFDLYRISSKNDLLSHEWTLFCDRFRRSAARGRRSEMFRGVGGVLGEMGDNVCWHAFEAADKPCSALAGFYVSDRTASFCVADSGQGFLRSLQRSPTWAELKTENAALRTAYKLRHDTRILLVGVDEDARLESFWSEHRTAEACEALAALQLDGITVPNFSHFTDVPRFQNLRNRKRILLSAERLSDAGVSVSFHINANTEGDWDFTLGFLKEHSEATVVTMEFQTGARANGNVGQEVFDELVRLQDRLGWPLHPLLIGAARYYTQAQREFQSFSVIDSQPFMRTLARQILICDTIGKPRWRRFPTRRGDPLDDLFETNILRYPTKLNSDLDEERELPDVSPDQLELGLVVSTPYLTAQPWA